MGKALLAFLPHERVQRVLSRPLAKLCTRTITSAERLHAELDEIRARGYATSFEETNPGLWGIAVPILDPHGWAYSSVGIGGPLTRFVPSQLAQQVAQCNAAAARIARPLGLVVWSPLADQRDSRSSTALERATRVAT
jgi:IclR family acetate operon transcriptional repressor